MEDFPLKTDLIQIKGKAKNGKVKVVKYDRSFLSRVIQNDKIKRFYDELKNYCLSFEKVKARSSWGAEGFVVGTENVVKFIVTGGALCVCLAISPDKYTQEEYPHADLSEKKEFAATPMMVPVRTAQEAKLARRLVAEAFTDRCVYTLEFPARADYVESLPSQKDEALIKKNLIKKTESEMSEADAKKAVAAALKAEAEEEKALEEICAVKKKRAPKKQKEEQPEQVVEVEEAPVQEEAPAQEPAPKQEEADEEESQEAEEDALDTVFELSEGGLVIEVKYDRSFLSRIIQNAAAKRYYSDIKNYALSFGVKPRLSWKADSFYLGRKTYFVIKVRGKTLTLYLALTPAAYDEKIYHHKDVSDKKIYEKTPMMVRVRSDLGLKKAKKLIAEMFAAASLAEGEAQTVDYAAQYPYEDTDALIEKKLIKRFERKLDETESAAVLKRGEVIQPEVKQQPQEPEVEDVVFELFEEEPTPEEDIEDVVFELAPEEEQEEEQIEDVVFEAVTQEDESEDEDVSFELVDTPAEEPGMESYGKEKDGEELVTLRKYLRGFVAKMRQGDQDRKDYYAEIKSKMLSYKGVKVAETFSGDGYKKGSRALLKTRIRGKTLCLFFALNPDEYKQTVYRHQFKGDTKAYAATPMMVRVRSEQGLKRALRLIEELERNYELQAGTPADTFAIRNEYMYEETDSLVEKGLIKTRLVTVTAYEAEHMLKKKIK